MARLFLPFLAAVAAALVWLGSAVSAADLPPSSVVLKGLKSVRVVSLVSHDSREMLADYGKETKHLDAELVEIAKSKLAPLGISVQADKREPTGDVSEPTMTIGMDLTTRNDELEVYVKLTDEASLVRSPGNRFPITAWMRRGFPGANESGPVKEMVAQFMDAFVADYTAANPQAD